MIRPASTFASPCPGDIVLELRVASTGEPIQIATPEAYAEFEARGPIEGIHVEVTVVGHDHRRIDMGSLAEVRRRLAPVRTPAAELAATKVAASW